MINTECSFTEVAQQRLNIDPRPLGAEIRISVHCPQPGGPGEWIAAIGVMNGSGELTKFEMSDFKDQVSEEQLELRGVIASLTWLKQQGLQVPVIIWCKSAYLKDTFGRGRYHEWKANGWRLGSGHTPRNSERLHQLHDLIADQILTWNSLDELDHLESVSLDEDLRD
ncbi:hypothetical protein [Devosia sp. SD17-2]|uniref:hypothetical protein n=1 Tax=Devosia sp. SD17-2 TaxID=2976459 RepID=UPI0023D888D3|nr:hypothetical protein [Devosia sp. SD17-2]WEJ31632.1 hypothetical protein NYQ88_12000 [Devosia sp. SD17-2]